MGEDVYSLACPVKRLASVVRSCALLNPAIPHPPKPSPTHSDPADWKTAENNLYCWGQILTLNIFNPLKMIAYIFRQLM